MNRYIALLRGINISRKNKIAMSELKEGFIKLHFTDVSTGDSTGGISPPPLLSSVVFK